MSQCQPRLVCDRKGKNCNIITCMGQQYILNLKLDPDIYEQNNEESIVGVVKLTEGKNVDLRNRLPEVWAQGKIGSCTAQSISALLMAEKIATTRPSTLFIYFNARAIEGDIEKDEGVSIAGVIKSIQLYGFCKEESHPYKQEFFVLFPALKTYQEAFNNRGIKFKRIPIKVEDLCLVLEQEHPIMVGLYIYDSFFESLTIETGVIKVPDREKEELRGGHCVVLVGVDYDKQCFILRNSWGTKWGNNGHGFLPFDYVKSYLMVEPCYISG